MGMSVASASTPGCRPILKTLPGKDPVQLLADLYNKKQRLVIGEWHGKSEDVDLLLQALPKFRGLKHVVLEWPSDFQKHFDELHQQSRQGKPVNIDIFRNNVNKMLKHNGLSRIPDEQYNLIENIVKKHPGVRIIAADAPLKEIQQFNEDKKQAYQQWTAASSPEEEKRLALNLMQLSAKSVQHRNLHMVKTIQRFGSKDYVAFVGAGHTGKNGPGQTIDMLLKTPSVDMIPNTSYDAPVVVQQINQAALPRTANNPELKYVVEPLFSADYVIRTNDRIPSDIQDDIRELGLCLDAAEKP
jgi:predicted component of viral defense system (DUF524 family)